MDHKLTLETSRSGLSLPLHVDGRWVHALVPAESLERALGAGRDPSSWLAAYRQHAGRVNRAAIRKHRAEAADAVVLSPDDLLAV